MSITLTLIGALLLDRLLGEPSRLHPLVGFGRWASWIEHKFYPGKPGKIRLFCQGALSWLTVIGLPIGLAVMGLELLINANSAVWYLIVSVIVVYLAIAPRSLSEHALAVAEPLKIGDLPEAREKLSYLVSRDTEALDANMISKATVESVLENSHDAVVAPIFWFVVAGLPGIILFRMVNTLDAMWGYRNARYNYFGRLAARADDVMGYLSARVTVMLFTIMKPGAAMVVRKYGRKWYSPNAGPVMAAGAGALNVSLGGLASYHNESKQRPILGDGQTPKLPDIYRAISLTNKSYWLLVALVATVEGIFIAFESWG